jgi:hypothetical protein
MSRSLPFEGPARSTLQWMRTDRAARYAFLAAIGVAVVAWYIVGRSQYFIRDDWAFLITRDLVRDASGWKRWLFEPTAGHWMTVPILIYRGLRNAFGLDSYWPFLSVNLALHLGIVLCVRQLCRRVGVSEWTNTLVCGTLLVFGAGWENIVFAIQITCNLSLLAFLLQILLTDHEGRVDRRDIAGSACALIGVMSSGFGAFFLVGIAVLLVLRRRWVALAVAVVPQAIVLGLWAVTWGNESSEPRVPGPVSQVNTFAIHGIIAVFDSLTSVPGLGGVGALGALGVTLWRAPGWRAQTIMITLALTAGGMYLGLGYERIGFGVEGGGISRYQHIGAMLLAPAFALAVDRLRALAPEAMWAGRVVLLASVAVNAGTLHANGSQWKIRAQDERYTFELIAGSPLKDQVDQDLRPVDFSPDVSIASLALLVADGALVPRTPTTPDEIARVRKALKLAP